MTSASGRQAWPALRWEERPWGPALASESVSRAARRRHTGPYRAALLPTIAGRDLDLPGGTLAAASDAAAAIARFDAEAGGELAPFVAVLLRTESTSSSRIENLTSSARSVVLAEMGDRSRRNATAIAGNVSAMTAALRLADRLDAEAILAMHHALLASDDPRGAGRWREQQVWVGGSMQGPHDAAFVPPHHDHIEPLVDDLVAFCQRVDLPLLAQAAVAHAQFETIHPFTDGNGRTGRALIHAMLRGHGLTSNVTVPVSAGLLAVTPAYFEALTNYRDGDPAPIVALLAAASFAAIGNGRQLVADLRTLRQEWNERIVSRRGAVAWRLADLLLRQPIVDSRVLASALGIGPGNAARPIGALVTAGILTEITGARRNRMWQAPEVLALLDDFAARAGRRIG